MSEPTSSHGEYPVPVEIAYALVRIEAKLNRALDDHGIRLDAVEHHSSDHEARIRAIEGKPVLRPANIYSAAAIIIPICAILVALWAQGN